MNTVLTLKPFRIILAITLIYHITPINPMKRVHQEPPKQDIIAGVSLPSEIVQKILGSLPDKYNAIQVCKRWKELLNFKAYWFSFIKTDDIARTLHLAHDAKLRIYRLLLGTTKRDDLELLKTMLAHDPDRSAYLTEMSTITHTPLSHLMSDRVASSETGTLYKHILPAVSAHTPNAPLEPEQKGAPEHTQRISKLCDILLCDDQEELDQFLADPTLNILFNEEDAMVPGELYGDVWGGNGLNVVYNVDFLIDNDLITRFCPIATVKKIIPLLKQIYLSCGEDDDYRLADYLLHRTLFGTVQRLDIADELLRHGAKWKFLHPQLLVEDFRQAIIIKQDSQILELLVKYGFTLDDLCYLPGSYNTNASSLLWYSVNQQKSPAFIQKLIDLDCNPFEAVLYSGDDILAMARTRGNLEIVKILEDARSNQQAKYAALIAQHLGISENSQPLDIIGAYEKAWCYFPHLCRNQGYYAFTSAFINRNLELTDSEYVHIIKTVAQCPIESSTDFINTHCSQQIDQHRYLAEHTPLLYKSLRAIIIKAHDILNMYQILKAYQS